jgi:hypothetical protein
VVFAPTIMMAVGMTTYRSGLWQKFPEALDESFKFCVACEKLFDLGTKLGALFRGLLVSKYVVIVLHL